MRTEAQKEQDMNSRNPNATNSLSLRERAGVREERTGSGPQGKPRVSFTERLTCLLLSFMLAFLPVLSYASESITYYHWDALGSPVAATDNLGNVEWREQYRPYGERIQNQAAARNNTRWYTGHPHDDATGLTYAGARYYDPVLGRFMGVDPKVFSDTDPFSFNRYAYANDNPYAYVDLNGWEATYFQRVIAGMRGQAVGAYTGLAQMVTFGTALEGSSIDTSRFGEALYEDSELADAFQTGFDIGIWAPAVVVSATASKSSSPSSTSKESPVVQVNPRNLRPTQSRGEMSGSQVKRLTKDMKQRGFDQSKPVDVTRSPSGRLDIQDGHHRTEAAKKAGLEKIPVRILE